MMHRIESQGLLFATKHFSLRQNRISLAFVVALTSAACEREEAKRERAQNSCNGADLLIDSLSLNSHKHIDINRTPICSYMRET